MKKILDNVGDTELFLLLKQGDIVAFETLYRRYWKVLFDNAYKRLPDEDKCKDIIQNIFVDVWNRRETVSIDKPVAYLFGAVRFQVLKTISKQSNHAEFYSTLENEIISPSRADEPILTKEAQLVLKLFLAALPKQRRKIFTMHYFDGYSAQDISKSLDISEKTVRNQLSEASRMVRLRITHLLSVFLALFFLL